MGLGGWGDGACELGCSSKVVCKRAEFIPVLLLKIKKLTHYVAALHLSTNIFS